MRRLNINFVCDALAEEGYKLLSTIYINSASKLKYQCPNGHIREFTWNNWKQGARCRICANTNLSESRRLDFKFVVESFESENYTILSCDYTNAASPIKCKCDKGHIFETCWRDWYSGNRCPECSKNKLRVSYDYIKSQFSSEGYTLLSTYYRNNKTNLQYKCPKGNIHVTTWNRWSRGNRCECCNSKSKLDISFVRASFNKESYELLSTFYTNNKTKLKYKCPNGHIHSITWGNWITGYRCPSCCSMGVSQQENDLFLFIQSINSAAIKNDRLVIAPYELDIVVPDLKIAIEYCGLYWHSELSGKDKYYHLNKLNLCNKNGYRLFTVFEDEWLSTPDIVKSVLVNKLNHFDGTRVYARKCVVKEISTQDARKFCDSNHLQGYAGSSIKLGLFYGSILVSVMTFSKQSITKGRKHKEGNWELSRFCNKLNYLVVGGASKLLKYFESNYFWDEIVSYADRRWSDGSLYTGLNFICTAVTNPNYWYFKKSDINRIYRFSLRKKFGDPTNMTEWELRKSQGYNRIWDCGNLRYIKSRVV